MPIQHKDIPEAYLHEPKGVSSAAADRVYVSNGSGSGSWKKLPIAGVDTGAAVAGSFLVADGAGGLSAKASLYRYAVNVGTLSSIAANTTAEHIINVAGIVASSDEVLQVTKPTNQAGLIVANARIAVDGQLILQFANITGSAITPTASEVYIVYIWRR